MANSIPTNPKLPVEVIELAIDHIYDLYYEQEDVSLLVRHSTWRACALTCRQLRPRSQFWLFRHVNISCQQQAQNLVGVLRDNPSVAKYTRILAFWKSRAIQSFKKEIVGTWISCCALFVAPLMTNLELLYLGNDIFTKSHPKLPMILRTFRTVQRLELENVSFPSLSHLVNLIQGIPSVRHVSLRSITWKSSLYGPLLLPNPHINSTALRRPLRIEHLDIWSSHGIRDIVKWISRKQHAGTLRTLSCAISGQETYVPMLLQRGSELRSVFLSLRQDHRITGLKPGSHKSLRYIHVQAMNLEFPIQVVNSILSCAASSQLAKLSVYVAVAGSGGEPSTPSSVMKPTSEIIDAFAKLDDILSSPSLARLAAVLYLYGPNSANAVPEWQQKLSSLLPKSPSRFRVEGIRHANAYIKWIKRRDEV